MGTPNTIQTILAHLQTDARGCWLWTRATDPNGYGRVRFGGRPRKVHVVLFEHYRGPVPGGLQLDHLCRQPACANPEHLEPVTPRVNSLRSQNGAARNAAKSHCCRGHLLFGDNLYVNPKGERQCRACGTRRRQLYEATHRETRREASHQNYLERRDAWRARGWRNKK